jgi:adenosylhomocysteine nucleosidase
VVVVKTGVGPQRALAACREILGTCAVDLAVSAGVACALVPARIGDLLIGTGVRGAGDQNEIGAGVTRSCAGEVVEAAVRAAERTGLRARTGLLVTTSRVLWQCSDKRVTAEQTAAIGVDMESAAVALAAAECQVAFASIRSVSDLLDEPLPVDFNRFLQPGGWLNGLASCVRQPSCVVGLTRLYRQVCLASDRTSRFFESFLDDQQSVL